MTACAAATWTELQQHETARMPKLGSSVSDFSNLDAVLTEALKEGSAVSVFLNSSKEHLRAVGHGAAAASYNASSVYERSQRQLPLLEWGNAFHLGHLLLPCICAEFGADADKGVTRLCFPFIDVATNLDVEKAMEDLCKLTWCLGLACDENLVANTCLKLVPHKMQVEEDQGELWFNKSCASERMATAIKQGDKHSLVYMYLGGGVVDQHQASMMHGIVAVCKSWQWAHLTYCAARIVGIRCSNQLGELTSDLFSVHDSDTQAGSSKLVCDSFLTASSMTWQRCCLQVSPKLGDMNEIAEFNKRKQRVKDVQTILNDFAEKLSLHHSAKFSSDGG